MRNWFYRINETLQRWMYGRYGYDELNKFLSITAIVLILLSLFVPALNSIALFLLLWSMFRTCSKNLTNRQKERDTYLKVAGKVKQFFKLRKNMWRDRKTHRYYKCPSCNAYLRVPKGKGKIEISCPKCRNKITRKT